MADGTPDNHEHRRHRTRAWFLGIGLGVLGTLAGLLIAANFVIASQWPREKVVALLERSLGMRLQAGTLAAGVGGESVATDVTMALPLSDEPVLRVPRLRISHTGAISLLLGSGLSIQGMEFDRPALLLRQDASGQWNIAEAVALLTRGGGGQSGPPPAQAPSHGPRSVRMPRIVVNDGTIILVDQRGRSETIHPFNVRGVPQDALVWKLDLQLGSYLQISGDFAPGENWHHRLALAMNNAGPLLRPFLGDIGSASARAEWRGQIQGGNVSGRLNLSDASVAGTRLAGNTRVEIAGGAFTVQPDDLKVTPTGWRAPVALTGGSARIESPHAKLDQLLVSLWGGNARLSGDLDWRAKSAKLDAAWSDVALTPSISHSGEAHIELQTPWENRPQIKATIQTRGRASPRHWEGTAALEGRGLSWDSFDWTVQLPQFAFHGRRRTATADHLTAQITQRKGNWQLDSLAIPNSDAVRAMAGYDGGTGRWWAWTQLRHAAVPLLHDVNADIMVNAWGDSDQITLNELQLSSGWFGFSGSGTYVFGRPKPLEVALKMWRRPLRLPGDHSRAAIGGDLWGDLNVAGTVAPLGLGLGGSLYGDDVIFGQRHVGNLAIKLEGGADESAAYVRSTRFELLGGQWAALARYEFDQDAASLRLNVADVSLTQLDSLLSPPPKMQGTLAGAVQMDLPRRGRRMSADGNITITQFQRAMFGEGGGQMQLAAETIKADVSFNDGILKVRKIDARQGEGRLSGSIQLNNADPRVLEVEARPANWPVAFPQQNLSASLSGRGRMEIGLADHNLRGPVTLDGPVTLGGKKLGTLALESAFGGRMFRINRLRFDVLGGQIQAFGQLNLDHWMQSAASVRIDHVDLSRLPAWWRAINGLEGAFDATLAVAPSAEPHAPEPLQINLSLRPTNTRFRGIQIGDGDFVCFAGGDRFLVQQASIAVAGGRVDPWMRLSRPTGVWAMHATAAVENLSLDQITHAISPTANFTPGLLAGNIILLGEVGHPRRSSGQAMLELRDANLLHNTVIATLFNAAGGLATAGEPVGHGRLRATLEGGVVDVTDFFYTNRGLSVRGTGSINNFFALSLSPVQGHLVASARPFKSIRVPILADAEKVLAVLQRSLTTVRVEGTLGQPRPRIVPFEDVGQSLRSLLVGDVGAAGP